MARHISAVDNAFTETPQVIIEMEQGFLKRESAVVTEGLGPGLQDAVSTTWSDLQQAKKDFATNPSAPRPLSSRITGKTLQ